VTQGSDKQCRLTAQGKLKLKKALEDRFGKGFDNSQVARELLENVNLRETVAKVRDAEEWVVKNSIERLFTPLDLDLKPEDYASKPRTLAPKSQLSAPNPFEQTGLWGCDELLRQIFERLGKGGSQALIGPTGCGKTEILRRIEREEATLQRPILRLDMHLVRDERSFFDRLCDCFELEPGESLSRVPMQIERELKRRKQAHLLCLDEIHVLRNEAFFPEATRNWLKGMADAVYPLQLVVTSQKELRDLFPDSSVRSSPLADFFDPQTRRLEYWALAEVRGFVSDRLSTTGIQFEPEQIEGIQQRSGGKPKLVRELAWDLYEEISGGDRL
jgi:hypothetical protein